MRASVRQRPTPNICLQNVSRNSKEGEEDEGLGRQRPTLNICPQNVSRNSKEGRKLRASVRRRPTLNICLQNVSRHCKEGEEAEGLGQTETYSEYMPAKCK